MSLVRNWLWLQVHTLKNYGSNTQGYIVSYERTMTFGVTEMVGKPTASSQHQNPFIRCNILA